MQPGSSFEARIGAVPQQRKNKQTKKDKTRQKKTTITKQGQNKQNKKVLFWNFKILALIVQENIF